MLSTTSKDTNNIDFVAQKLLSSWLVYNRTTFFSSTLVIFAILFFSKKYLVDKINLLEIEII